MDIQKQIMLSGFIFLAFVVLAVLACNCVAKGRIQSFWQNLLLVALPVALVYIMPNLLCDSVLHRVWWMMIIVSYAVAFSLNWLYYKSKWSSLAFTLACVSVVVSLSPSVLVKMIS